MAHLIDKSAVVAEIERLENKLYYEPENFKDVGAKMALDSLKSFLNTLEVKEPASEDLEQATRNDSDDELYAIHFEKWGITGECPSELEAKIDAKFGITSRDSNGKPSNGYCDWKKDVFTNGSSIYSFVKLGMDYQKEQMMKDAVEATIVEVPVGRTGGDLDLLISIPESLGLKDGDEVKVIIIKE